MTKQELKNYKDFQKQLKKHLDEVKKIDPNIILNDKLGNWDYGVWSYESLGEYGTLEIEVHNEKIISVEYKLYPKRKYYWNIKDEDKNKS